MSFFNSWKSHYTVGFAYGLVLRFATSEWFSIWKLDRWAAARERKQSGKKPEEPLSSHQLKEAMAWGAGARKSAGVDMPYQTPAYPEDAKWS